MSNYLKSPKFIEAVIKKPGLPAAPKEMVNKHTYKSLLEQAPKFPKLKKTLGQV